MKEQVAPQLMLASLLVMVPEPVPVLLTVKANCGEKVAVTFAAELPTVRLQVPVPVQAPVQPANTKPAPGAAVRMIESPVAIAAEHEVAGQSIPPTSLVTEPDPAPPEMVTLTVSLTKSALTARAVELLVMTHCLLTLTDGQPLQPLNTEPPLAVAVSVTE